MKAEDLMIGDWVLSKIHGIVTRVVNIEGYRTDAVWLEDKKCWQRHFMSEIEPIPLTEDILVKNGWDKEYHTIKEGNLYIEIYRTEDGFDLGINDYEYTVLSIRYVHELQHILRLWGIKKKIQI